jgi:Barrel-sandwich domain of CusB or HlyD membrane-fusion
VELPTAVNSPVEIQISQSKNPAASYQAFVHLEERARAAKSVRELLFSLANESWQLLGQRQAFIWDSRAENHSRLRVVSGIAQLGEDSPFTVWLKRLGVWLAKQSKKQPGAQYINIDDIHPSLHEGWKEWLPDYLFIVPLHVPNRGQQVIVAFALEEGLDDTQAELAQRLADAYGHAWAALEPKSKQGVFARGYTGWRAAPRKLIAPLLLLLTVLAMFIPVRLSVLANAEIIALDAAIISAPLDGVIKTFHVQPNQAVKKDEPLFTLDETSLKNRREVAFKQLQVAKADAMAAQQKSFDNETSRSELAGLNGRVAERQAELASVEDQFGRIQVRAPASGVVVFGDINDWLGKPVSTGERVALLADPKDAGVLVWLPVSEAINLEAGAQIKLYLQIAPLKPLVAILTQTSYQAVLSPEGISAYRLKAQLQLSNADEQALARIGLKGTAKIYGEKAILGYYLFRRPIAFARELTGL